MTIHPKPAPDFRFETDLMAAGARVVAGVDEVGRGPLAGPVTAAAVILHPDRIPSGLNDSKRLSAKRREALLAELEEIAEIGLGWASVSEIDALNIRNAAFLAMRRAVEALPSAPDHVLVDGNACPPGPALRGLALGEGRRALRVDRGGPPSSPRSRATGSWWSSTSRIRGMAGPAMRVTPRRPIGTLCNIWGSRRTIGDPSRRSTRCCGSDPYNTLIIKKKLTAIRVSAILWITIRAQRGASSEAVMTQTKTKPAARLPFERDSGRRLHRGDERPARGLRRPDLRRSTL